MRFTFELTEQDYLDFNLYYVRFSRNIRRSVLFSRILVVLIILSLAFLKSSDLSENPLPVVIGSIILAGLAFFFFPSLFYRLVERKTRKMMRELKNNFTGGYMISLEEDRIVVNSPVGESTVLYSAIAEIKLSDKAAYLFTGPANAIIVPYRAFASPAERDGAIALLQRKVSSAH